MSPQEKEFLSNVRLQDESRRVEIESLTHFSMLHPEQWKHLAQIREQERIIPVSSLWRIIEQLSQR